MNRRHAPVLLAEVLDILQIKKKGTYIDGTFGHAGHARAILQQLGPDGRLLALDQDPAVIEPARAEWRDEPRMTIKKGTFSNLASHAAEAGLSRVDGVLLDIGVRSDQLDNPLRGFSFRHDGPLDMRMDPSTGTPAEAWVNQASEQEIRDVIWRYGEERKAGRIASAILQARQKKRITRTLELAEIISKATGGRRGKIHPATRSFQAIRVFINRELEELEAALEAGIQLLTPGGILAVISFHSLEDRIVKHGFAAHAGREVSLPQGGSRWEGRLPRVQRITRKPIGPTATECERNPRARSAKLRAVQRLDDGGPDRQDR